MMSKRIDYCLEFLSDWLCSSGLSAGVTADVVPVRDREGLPYVPGKTIKGVLRETAFEIDYFKKNSYAHVIVRLFGQGADQTSDSSAAAGRAYFSSALLPQDMVEQLMRCDGEVPLAKYLFRSVAAIAIDESGLVREHTLRKLEVCMPIRLYGYIEWQAEEYERERELLEMAMKWVKCMGSWRNRGLGRCRFRFLES